MPENYVWSDIEIGDAAQLDELYTLLTENYVEDDENMFRFDYSREFLKWLVVNGSFWIKKLITLVLLLAEKLNYRKIRIFLGSFEFWWFLSYSSLKWVLH